jgi:hypothetical protein
MCLDETKPSSMNNDSTFILDESEASPQKPKANETKKILPWKRIYGSDFVAHI